MTEEQIAQPAEAAEEQEQAHDLYGRQVGKFERLCKEDWEKALSIGGFWHVHAMKPEDKMELYAKFGYKPIEPREFYNLGVAAALEGDYKKAEKHFKRALEENPDFNEAVYNLALTYEELGNISKSVELWQLYQERIGSRHEDYSSVRSHIRTLKKKVE
jgi:tetratricopeptide (TPR) repeat protein